jgi:hypothetical protein
MVEHSSPPLYVPFEGSIGIAASEPLCSRVPQGKNVAKRMTTFAHVRRRSLPQPKSDERKKRWATMHVNLLPSDNFARRSAMIKACLDVLGDAPDAP